MEGSIKTTEGSDVSKTLKQPQESDINQCFLCLQTGSYNNGSFSAHEKHWIQNIFQYLGVSSKELIRSVSNEYCNGSSETSENVWESAEIGNDIKLCSSCTEITAKLSSLIRRLEVTQMWIDYQIQQVIKILQVSDNGQSRVDLMDSEVQKLRQTLQSKCYSEASRIVGPTVKLERVEVLPVDLVKFEAPDDLESEGSDWSPGNSFGDVATKQEEINAAKIVSQQPSSPKDFELDSTIGLAEDQFQNSDASEVSQQSDQETSDLDVKPRLSTKMPVKDLAEILCRPATKYFNETHVPNKSLQCVLCKANVFPKGGSQKVTYFLEKHLAKQHVEEFFVGIKLKELDNNQFAKYCRHAISLETQKYDPLKNGTPYKCPYCSHKYHDKYLRGLVHLMRSHYNILQQKISQFQNNMVTKSPDEIARILNANELANKMLRTKSKCGYWAKFHETSKQYYKQSRCVFCQQTLKVESYKEHLVRFHPETMFTDCGTWYNAANKETFHKLCVHVLNLEAKLMKQVKWNDGEISRTQYECHLCKARTDRLENNLYHVASHHCQVLFEKLKNLDNDKNLDFSNLHAQTHKFQQNRCTKLLSAFCSQYIEKLAGPGEGKCTLCNELVCTAMKNKHFYRNHTDKIFEEMKLENVSDHQFKLCCRELINREFSRLKCAMTREKKKLKCLYCEKNLKRSRAAMKEHLTLHHSEIVEEQLVRFQTEKKWENEPDTFVHYYLCRTKRKLEEKLSALTSQYIEKLAGSGGGKCTLCNESVVMKRKNKHFYINHTDKIFEEMKLENVSDLQFKLCCEKLINSEFSQVKCAKNHDKWTRKCVYCEYKLPFDSGKMKAHLTVHHFEIVEEQLVRLQTEKYWESEQHTYGPYIRQNRVKGKVVERLSAISSQYIEKLAGSGGGKCTLCNESVVMKRKKPHFYMNHTEKVFEETKLKNVSDHQFKLCCDKLINSEFSRLKRAITRDKTARKCLYCEKNLKRSRAVMKEHLTLHHFEIVEEQLVRLQTERNWENEQDTYGPYIRRKRVKGKLVERLSAIISQYVKKLADSGRGKCTLCNDSFFMKFNRQHFYVNHTDKIFEETKLENVSDHQFILCCGELMNSEFSRFKGGTTRDKMTRKCLYCEKVLKNSRAKIKQHLTVHHFEVVEEQLVRLQTESNRENEQDTAGHYSESKVKRKLVEREERVPDHIKCIKLEEYIVESDENGQSDALLSDDGHHDIAMSDQ